MDSSAQVEPPPTAEIGVIGGSGFYRFLDDVTRLEVSTPYGPPAAPVTVGTVGGRQVAFLPRHGLRHEFPPHRVPYRANVWALHSLGVRQILAPCAVGSLSPELGAGSLVVPDQLVDRTSGRAQTYYDGPSAVHVSFADPYCPAGRRTVLAAAAAEPAVPMTDGGTMVVIEGPRFSTRAESQWYAAAGWSLVNMTGHPEAVLARELAVCYTAIALVTDLDAGIDVGSGVTQDEVFRVFEDNLHRLRDLLMQVIAALPANDDRPCPCGSALNGTAAEGTLSSASPASPESPTSAVNA
jgi:5'-methylthioadenosine phosphorylase